MSEDNSSTDLIELYNSSVVQNSDTLISNGLNIDKIDEQSYIVSSLIKNSSEHPMDICNIKLKLYNQEKQEITSFDFVLDAILPNSHSTLLNTTTVDLTNCFYYILSIEQ